MKYGYAETPVGTLLLLRDEIGLRGLYFPEHRHGPTHDPAWTRDEDAVTDAREQLAEYMNGDRTEFDLPLHPVGTAFQQRVWSELRAIPYGHTTTYGAIASSLGSSNAVRAVGSAVGRNPLSIIVPCHRVVGSSGSLTGFAGGLAAKRGLLDIESRQALLTLPPEMRP